MKGKLHLLEGFTQFPISPFFNLEFPERSWLLFDILTRTLFSQHTMPIINNEASDDHNPKQR